MVQWSMAAEYLAFILILMIALFYYERRQAKTVRRRIFEAGLWLAEISIFLNMVGVYTIENFDRVPYWLNVTVNNGYFLVSVWMATVVAAYLFDLLLEHVYDKRCRTKAVTGLSILTGGYTMVVISNYWSGLLFWFDEQGEYHRGSCNRLGYVILWIELLMITMCYCRNRASVEKNVKRVIYTLPPLIFLMAIFQVIFPEILLNGTIISFAVLIIFVNFQNFKVGRDSLTGIGNRKSFYEELHLRLSGGQKFQVIMISLNGFAAVNQQFGYRKGDEFLYHISRWLEECRKEGRAFRFSNVTFALLCPYVDEEDSAQLLSIIRGKFREAWTLGENECRITASFGMMSCEDMELNATQVVELLTFLSELAKGREDGVVILDGKTREMYRMEKKLERLLSDAIEKGRLEVWFQPIMDCRTGGFHAAEALVRMRDEEGKLVSPADFIPLAEKNRMIEKIGSFVWNETCRFLGSNPGISLQSVSVNMSAQQFSNPQLCENMEESLHAAGITADRVKLEITERVIWHDERYMKQLMDFFVARGFAFCVDDFGTGYSNFSSVMHFPFECIKLDRSLIDKLPADGKDRLVVRSMIEMFHAMGLKVVAEGVETKEQQEIIREMGADFIQGFYYAKPMPEAEAVAFFAQQEAAEDKCGK